jgi:ferredoxin
LAHYRIAGDAKRSWSSGPMADNTHNLPENVPGPWYVDDTCTPCRVCLDEAPQLLKDNDDETYVYFFKQAAAGELRRGARPAINNSML